MIKRIALAAASLALVLGGGAQAASATDSTITAAPRALTDLCPLVLTGKVDMNDATTLGRFGLTPMSDEAEQAFRSEKHPETQMARADLADGRVLVGSYTNTCMVVIFGDNRFAAQDATVAKVKAAGGTVVTEKRLDDVQYIELKFLGYAVLSQRQDGTTAVAVSIGPRGGQ